MSDHRHFKDSVYESFARVAKALAAPKRHELLDLLCQGPRTVEVLSKQAAVSITNVSQHLQILRAASLVTATLMLFAIGRADVGSSRKA